MKKLSEIIEESLYYDNDGNPLFEMANLSSSKTGIRNQNLIIYISTKQGSHGPRVKVFRKGQSGRGKPCITFSIEQKPRILDIHGLEITKKDESDIKFWISINHVILLKLWNTLDWENVEIGSYLDNLDRIY